MPNISNNIKIEDLKKNIIKCNISNKYNNKFFPVS